MWFLLTLLGGLIGIIAGLLFVRGYSGWAALLFIGWYALVLITCLIYTW